MTQLNLRTRKAKETFGQRLRRLREAMRLSQQELATAAGLSKTYLWQLETEASFEPSASTLKSLSDVLGYSMDALWIGGSIIGASREELLRHAMRIVCNASQEHLDEICESVYQNPAVKLRRNRKR